MIKILKHGETMKEGKCPYCKCVFEYGEGDLTAVFGTREIRCPECGQFICEEELQNETD